MDYPYIVNYFTMLILAYYYWKKPNAQLVKWAFAIEFVFFAFRAPVVGADTLNYIRYLDGEQSFYNYDSRELEPGFLIYRQILVWLHCNSFFCMIINTIVSCFPIYLMIKKYSNNVPFTLAMFSILNVFYVYFCGLRQIIGLSILFMGLLYVLDDRRKKWLVFVICAILGYTFHTSIVIYTVILVIAYFVKFKSRNMIIMAISVSALVGIILKSFNVMDVFDLFLRLNIGATERIEHYMEEGQDVNEITSVFISIRPSLISIGVYTMMEKNKLNHLFSKIYAVGIILGNLFISVPMINRFTGGLLIFGPIVMTWVFGEKYYFVAKYRQKVNIVVLLFLLYFSQMYVKNNLNANIDLLSSSRMHPYQFFWEDYKNHPSIKYFK